MIQFARSNSFKNSNKQLTRVGLGGEGILRTTKQKDSAHREAIFHTSKSAQRSRKGVMEELTETLNRLNTSYLDLWQIHDVRDARDLDLISRKGGVLQGKCF